MNRSKIIIILLASLLLIGLGGLFLYLTSFGQLDITYKDSGTKITLDIYQSGKDFNDSKPIKTTDAPGSIRIKKGDYIVKSRENEEYASQSKPVTVGSKPSQVSIDPDYSSKKLDNLLKNELLSIKRSIFTAYPVIESDYSFSKMSLLKKGDWFSTLLVSKKSTPNNDTLRLVAQKQGNTWVIITRPPAIVINAAQYKSIPSDVITNINSQ